MHLIMNASFILQLSVVLGLVLLAEQSRMPETHSYWVQQLKPGEKIQWESVKDVALRNEKRLLETLFLCLKASNETAFYLCQDIKKCFMLNFPAGG